MEDVDGLSDFEKFIAFHRPQLQSAGVPEHFWQVLHTKLKRLIFDAGCTFSLFRVESEDENNCDSWKVLVILEDGISPDDPQNVFLIDHAWTFRSDMARRHLNEIPGLLERMTELMDISSGAESSRAALIGDVIDKMWKYCQTYSVGGEVSVENKLPVWYIMDEFGSRIQHSDEPNVRTVPFLHIPEQITYTLLFPIKAVEHMSEITRDYVEGPVKHQSERRALLLPWFPTSFLEETYKQEEPGEELFIQSRVNESLPSLNERVALEAYGKKELKVFSDYTYINHYLNDSRFQITSAEDEADILWYTSHFKEYKELCETAPNKFINQFPYEHVITVKDLLCIVCRRKANEDAGRCHSESLETSPLWLPTTYNLQTELVKFVSYFQNRERLGLNNHWIIKPWNLARGLDMHITNNLSYIMRLPFTGPKIAQKYVENPVLFHRPEHGEVKFDIRYVILLRSVKPLTAYAYKRFWLRFANKPFELSDFDDYEKHFTVMNYKDTDLCQMFCADFIRQFEQQYPSYSWKGIEQNIFGMFRSMLEGAVCKEPPYGIAHNSQSRALYAVDLMLAWRESEEGKVMQPKLLELNWTPDCQRACEYYPDFYNDVFAALFLDDVDEEHFYVL